MMRLLCLSALVVFTCAAPLAAQEKPEKQLEFVRSLRARGLADLAMEYLDQLRVKPDPAIAPVLPLESALTRIRLARSQDPEERAATVATARAELQAFIKANPKRPEGTQARLEIARIISNQAKEQLTRALRQDDPKQQLEEAKKAEQLFIQAGQELEEAAKVVKGKDSLQARFDRAAVFLDQSRAYIDGVHPDATTKRAVVIDQGRKYFDAIAKEDANGPLGMMATAWLVKCYQQGQDYSAALKHYRKLMNRTEKEAIPAQRWAWLFYIQGIPKDPTLTKLTPAKKRDLIQQEAQLWLKEYPTARNSPEGQGVRFEMALAYMDEGRQQKDPKSPLATKLFNQAQKLFNELAESDSDLSEKANAQSLTISFIRMGETTPVEQLRDFDECFLKAYYEMGRLKDVVAKMEDAKGAALEKLEKQRKEHLETVVRAFSRGLTLADERTPPPKKADARYFLTFAYMSNGDLFRAAVSGEALARAQPPTKRSPTAAGYALEAYAAVASNDNDPVARDRIRGLAEFILVDNKKLWQAEAVTGVAHHQLALLSLQQEKPKEAIEHLEKLPKGFAGYTYAQGQLVFIALDAKEKAKEDKEKVFFDAKLRAALARLPQLPADADSATAAMYFHARMEQPKLIYAEGSQALKDKKLPLASAKYQEMAKAVAQLRQQFDKFTGLTSQTREKIKFTLDVLDKYARLGMGDTEYRDNNFDRVLAADLTGAVVDNIKKLAAATPKGPVRLKDHQVTIDVLALALRARVQKGDIKEATVLLKLLERISGEEDSLLADPTATVRSLVQEIQGQVRGLQRSGETEKLKKLIGSYTAFLDAVRAGQKDVGPRDLFLMAHLYNTLEQYCKAADLYKQVAPPKFLDKKELDKKEQEEAEAYWYSQIQYARSLRLCKEQPDNLKKANTVLVALFKQPNFRGHLHAEKEQIHILEDSGLYGNAITRWGKFMNNPTLKEQLPVNAELKEMYFEAYYHHAFCWYKYSQTSKVIAAQKDKQYLRKAVDYAVKLERAANPEGWQIVGQLFRELSAREEPFRVEYEEMKKNSK
jgi:hypothetical protein